MIDATRRKLREARFFLRKLREKSRCATHNEPEESAFYLSASLSAARSVTFTLQAEEKKNDDDWFPSWKTTQSQDDQELFMYLNGRRVAELHQTGAATVSPGLDWISVTEFRLDRNIHPAYGIHWSGMPGFEPPKIGLPILVFTGSDDERKVLQACEA